MLYFLVPLLPATLATSLDLYGDVHLVYQTQQLVSKQEFRVREGDPQFSGFGGLGRSTGRVNLRSST